MAFNNGYERRKFESEWKKLRREYIAAGMDEAAVEEMYRFDLDTFKSNRRFAEHTQAIPESGFGQGDGTDEGCSAILGCFADVFSTEDISVDPARRYGWVDEIEAENLSKALAALSEQDIELLTLLAFEGYSITEIAQKQKVSRPTVSKKIRRIKNFLKNF